MNRKAEAFLWTLAVLSMTVVSRASDLSKNQKLGTAGNATLTAEVMSDGRYRLVSKGSDTSSSWSSMPVRVEFEDAKTGVRVLQQGYDRVIKIDQSSFEGTGSIADGTVRFEFSDHWTILDSHLDLKRAVRVHGNRNSGYMTALTFQVEKPWKRKDVKVFIPGMVYGGLDHIPDHSLGGSDVYTHMHGIVRIREDRMPAPLLGVQFDDGSGLTILDARPQGDSTLADSQDSAEWNDVSMMSDSRFKFGALGEDESCGWRPMLPQKELEAIKERQASCSPTIGFWYPGTEGESTYGGNARGVWRYRFHPIKDGATQDYEVKLGDYRNESFPKFMTETWRDAWATLHPPIVPINIEEARNALVSMLSANILRGEYGTGFPFFIDSVRGTLLPESRNVRMGFLGRNLQLADMFLYEASRRSDATAKQLRTDATEILDSFARLSMSPPRGDGFWVDNGLPLNEDIFLRSPSEDLSFMLSAWEREHKAGREHPLWLERPKEFGDWLLTQQQQDGGFPRSWRAGTNVVTNPSTLGSYNAIPILVKLASVTQNREYLNAAIRAGNLCWTQGQSQGVFVGGTEDNPNVIDKEAATLSLNAYVLLYEATHDAKWLVRARAAADNAESWIYLWNVAMPQDVPDSQLPWKKGVPTVGLQLIASGHSGADEYMSGDVANYAKLFKYTGDQHYYDVAKVLLKDTKSMMGMPGRTYDLAGVGWQQEAYTLAIPRTFIQHRVWLPWISAAQLSGIVQLEEFDPSLYKSMIQ
jgi:hypothetical protein